MEIKVTGEQGEGVTTLKRIIENMLSANGYSYSYAADGVMKVVWVARARPPMSGNEVTAPAEAKAEWLLNVAIELARAGGLSRDKIRGVLMATADDTTPIAALRLIDDEIATGLAERGHQVRGYK